MENYGSIKISLHKVNKEFLEKFIEYHRGLGNRPLPELKFNKIVHEWKKGKMKIVSKEVCYLMTSNEYADLLQLEILLQEDEESINRNYKTVGELKNGNYKLYEYFLRCQLRQGVTFKEFMNELKNK